MDFVPLHLRRFLGEATMPTPEEVARYRQANLRRNGQVRAEMDAAWEAKKKLEQDPIRLKSAERRKQNEMERMFRYKETGNPAFLNNGGKPTDVRELVNKQPPAPEEKPFDFEAPESQAEEGIPDENGLVWHSFDEVPNISDEQAERDAAFDPNEKLRDFRHSRNGQRRRFPTRRPEDFGLDPDDEV